MRYQLEHRPTGPVINDTRPHGNFCRPASAAEIEWWAEIKRLEAELAAARKVLEPFAEYANGWTMDPPDYAIFQSTPLITYGMFRAARTAMHLREGSVPNAR